MHKRPLLEEAASREQRIKKLLPIARKLKYSYYTKSFKIKNNNLVHKPVFEHKSCCLQRRRDITIITALVSVPVLSFTHTMREARHVP